MQASVEVTEFVNQAPPIRRKVIGNSLITTITLVEEDSTAPLTLEKHQDRYPRCQERGCQDSLATKLRQCGQETP